MQALTEDGQQMVNTMAARHQVSNDAVCHLLMAITAGGGRQAQFNHPELGGMGQWSQGGMIMVGDMFNQALKYRVDALCNDLAGALGASSPFIPAPMASQSQSQSGGHGVSLFVAGGFGNRWPSELGMPASTGSQNDLHYAVFPGIRRVAIEQGGQVTVYDSGDHHIGGVSQQQGGGQSLTFTSQHGLVRLLDLPVAPTSGQATQPQQPQPAPAAQTPDLPDTQPRPHVPEPPVLAPAPMVSPVPAGGHAPSPVRPDLADEAIFSRLERLAELCKNGIITEAEFAAKKRELLARL